MISGKDMHSKSSSLNDFRYGAAQQVTQPQSYKVGSRSGSPGASVISGTEPPSKSPSLKHIGKGDAQQILAAFTILGRETISKFLQPR